MTDDTNRMTRAGNYVLGLMDDHDRERAERDLEIDPAFRDAVVALAERMHVFDKVPAAEQAANGDWRRLTQHIADMPQMHSRGPDESSAALGRRRSDKPRHTAVTSAAPKPRRIALNSVVGWRAALMAASLVAAFAAGYLGGEAIRKASPPRVVAVLTAQADVTGAIVEAFSDGAIRIAPFGDVELPEGKVLQVWTVYDEAAGPVSLATLERSKDVLLDAGDHPSPKPGQFYQITLEPSPGSPTGKPTGPVVFSGTAPGD
jgi:anti-sigma-K factor RskA